MAIQIFPLPKDDKPPTDEIGTVLQGVFSPASMEAFVTPLMDLMEFVPELTWPTSVHTYHRMRADTQLGALYRGATLPIRRYSWEIDPNDADEKMVNELSKELGLPISGTKVKQPRRRHKNRFIFGEHLRKALLGLIYGHMFFEQVGEIGDDGKWHLMKLAERMPNTISQIIVEPTGELVSIFQNIQSNNFLLNPNRKLYPEIPATRLVPYVWDLEGGNWFGRSMFRECYKNWLIKDRLMRIDAINHARAGGVPIATAPPEATAGEIAKISQMTQEFKVGETSGGAVPYGTTFDVMKSTGISTTTSMQYHDEAMARFFMMMFMQLGQTRTGSRSLGATFIEVFKEAQDTIAWWFTDIFCEHMIEDWVDWNYGEDVDVVPMLTFKRDPDLAINEISMLISQGAIIVDADLEDALREELGLPDKAIGAVNPKPEVKPGPPPPPQQQTAPKTPTPTPLELQKAPGPVPQSQQPPGTGKQSTTKPPAQAVAADLERTGGSDGGLLPPSAQSGIRPLEAAIRFPQRDEE